VLVLSDNHQNALTAIEQVTAEPAAIRIPVAS
jgi:hypothetical protein